MFCVNCGEALAEKARFCSECGTPRPPHPSQLDQVRDDVRVVPPVFDPLTGWRDAPRRGAIPWWLSLLFWGSVVLTIVFALQWHFGMYFEGVPFVYVMLIWVVTVVAALLALVGRERQ